MLERVVDEPFVEYVTFQGPVPVKSIPKLLVTFKPHRALLFVKTAVGSGFTVKVELLLFTDPHEFV